MKRYIFIACLLGCIGTGHATEPQLYVGQNFGILTGFKTVTITSSTPVLLVSTTNANLSTAIVIQNLSSNSYALVLSTSGTTHATMEFVTTVPCWYVLPTAGVNMFEVRGIQASPIYGVVISSIGTGTAISCKIQTAEFNHR